MGTDTYNVAAKTTGRDLAHLGDDPTAIVRPRKVWPDESERRGVAWTTRYARPEREWFDFDTLPARQQEWDAAEEERRADERYWAERQAEREEAEAQRKAAQDAAYAERQKAAVLEPARMRYLAAGGTLDGWNAVAEKVWAEHLARQAASGPELRLLISKREAGFA